MAKYKTIVDNVNVYSNGEIEEVLKKGSIINVEKVISETDIFKRKAEIALLDDGRKIIASYDSKPTIEIIKKGVKK